MVVAPAVMVPLGDKAWWLPAWLDRLLPNVSLEGDLEEESEAVTAERERPKVAA